MAQMESMVLPPRLPLVVMTGNRNRTYTKDARLVNCYLETDDAGELWVYKRPGLLKWSESPEGAGLGSYYWQGNVYHITNGTLYKNGVTIPGALDILGGSYRFNETLGANPKLVFGNGNKTYTYNDIATLITSTSTSTVGGTLAAGTYYYVVSAILPQGITRQSNQVSITTTGATSSNTLNWTAVPGATGYRIYRGTTSGGQNLYYSVGAVTTFVDTGAASTPGTPPAYGIISNDLHSIDVDFPAQTVKGIVYLNGAMYVMDIYGQIWGSVPNSVDQPGDWSAIDFIAAQIEPDPGVALAKQLVYVIAFNSWSTEVFFDAGNPTGSPLGPVQGSKISYGCATAESVQQIDDRLLWISSTRSGAVQVSLLDQLNHQVVSTKPIDRLLQASSLSNVSSFQIKLDGHSFYVVTLRDQNITLAYDIVENAWHQWTDTNGNYFPFVSYTYNSNHQHILQHESNGDMYYAAPTYYTDDGSKIIVDIYTPIFDANTTRRKQLNLMYFVGDQETGSVLYIRRSEDDYQTWTNFRSVRLDKKRPCLTNCGTFTKAAYHFRHWSNTPLRMQAVEVQYDLGTL